MLHGLPRLALHLTRFYLGDGLVKPYQKPTLARSCCKFTSWAEGVILLDVTFVGCGYRYRSDSGINSSAPIVTSNYVVTYLEAASDRLQHPNPAKGTKC